MKGKTATNIKSPVYEPVKKTQALGNSLEPLLYSIDF
jgi:hypothetical protein